MYAWRDKTTFRAECTTKSVLAIRLMLLGLPCSRASGTNQGFTTEKVGSFSKHYYNRCTMCPIYARRIVEHLLNTGFVLIL